MIKQFLNYKLVLYVQNQVHFQSFLRVIRKPHHLTSQPIGKLKLVGLKFSIISVFDGSNTKVFSDYF